ncbi:hypothetical protein [Halomonas sp.]|uniref:hypothetical protein n=1 Tax=Halomonas sp. TaxID=1486246 RepID=UPI003563B8DB
MKRCRDGNGKRDTDEEPRAAVTMLKGHQRDSALRRAWTRELARIEAGARRQTWTTLSTCRALSP